ncbi:hypothetical protein HCU40_19710 (plasmid) [Pseudanabaena biceps]|nr:hypothetical protein [Pseudanabaena biceps]
MTNSDRPSTSYLDIAIHDYEPTVKAKIYEIVAKSGIPHDDPYIAIFLSNAQVAATIATGPTLIREALNKGFEVGIQKFARSLSSSMRELKDSEQEVVSDLPATNKKSEPQGQKYFGLISIAFIGAGMLAIGLTCGIASGLAIAKLLSPSSLNPQSAKDLEWLASDDGKLARNILDWNKDNLKSCQQNQQNLKEALIVMNGKYVTKGLCAFWVLPENKRVYEDRR